MSGFWEGLVPGLIRSYKTAVAKEGEVSPALADDALPLWLLMAFGLLWMQASLLTLLMVGGFNVFNSGESITENSSIQNLTDTALLIVGVFQRAPNLVFGAPAFVAAISLAISAVLSLFALSVLARHGRQILSWKINFQILSVRFFIAACRLGACSWIAVIAVVVIHKILDPTHYATNERILLGAFVSSIAAAMLWTIYPIIGRLSKREKHLRAQSLIGLMFLSSAAFYSLVEAAALSNKYYPPVVKMSVSHQCTKEGNCLLFLQAQNTKTIVVDEEIRIAGEFYIAGGDGSPDMNSPKRQFRAIKFKVVPVDETKAMAVLEPGKEEIVYAKDIVYCAEDETKALTPAADAAGQIRPHIVGGTGDFGRQVVTASMNRFYGVMLRHAEIAKC